VTIWSVIANRMDGLSKVWKEWRVNAVSTGGTPAQSGDIPLLNDQGQIDSSMIPSGSGGGNYYLSWFYGI